MIVTLAGHVDHGKTAIVKALTGVDTDRLEEEQARGLTIDLGFAYTNINDHRIGFVDVPGHHSFIHNMIAGVASMQHALLVVAADDGVMPQTEEHLQILQLLGIEQGTVVLNKVDHVDKSQLEQMVLQLRNFLQHTFLRNAPIVEASALTGIGIETLRDSLSNRMSQLEKNLCPRAFRLAIDRVFAKQGLGTVVTGTVYDGEIRVGDDVYLSSIQKKVRVRRIVANGLPVEVAYTGDRCGAQIAGVHSNEVSRGDWLRDPESVFATDTLTVQFELASGFPRDIKNWCSVHVYHGTSHRLGKLFVLDSIEDHGTNGIVDLVVPEPLHVAIGDRIIVRDQSLERTMGGGIVIATTAPTTRRRLPARIQRLRDFTTVASSDSPQQALIQSSKTSCVNGDDFRLQWNLTLDQFRSFIDRNTIQQVNNRFLAKSAMEIVRKEICSTLDEYHKTHSHEFGLTIKQLAKKTARDLETLRFVLKYGQNTGQFHTKAGQYAIASRSDVTVSYNKDLYRNLVPLIDTQQPLPVGDIARELKVPLGILENELKRMLKAKLFVQVSEKRFFTGKRLQELAEIAGALDKSGPFSVKQFRDQSGMGRMICIDVLEYFDKVRYTQREADSRRVVGKFDP